MPEPAESSERSRLARVLLPEGEEPDPRFTLANERTFLAWTRTSLAFMAGGVALDALPVAGLSDGLRTLLAVFVIAVGVLISLGAAVRWLRVERAMRTKKPLPVPMIVPLLSAAAVLACAAVLAADLL
ncbi:DUF202 domain-containing protein [Brevibacterium sp. 5221]|uniref:DUF202 domain-containing protein n=1 Tax=Brevibacterium rongguiense TaxID=2695267 RepID=A0A6N9H9K9_9MICO|nr:MULTISPECIES: DUF202 domain-containing protein [Brevibacterium]MYM20426.1 DUF202 domain-containing protein [Brevibacterium rongguiense]WAL39431.1 DUF202 domain-containing protein [Brevibacterium sp. BRM-1]